jgi:hypothetical protein
VELRACNPRDRNQLWGLDPESRYVNRGSHRCLTADQATGDVVTQSCDGLRFEQQWQWRADRLHSLANHARHRLYVEGARFVSWPPRDASTTTRQIPSARRCIRGRAIPMPRFHASTRCRRLPGVSLIL